MKQYPLYEEDLTIRYGDYQFFRYDEHIGTWLLHDTRVRHYDNHPEYYIWGGLLILLIWFQIMGNPFL